MAQEIKLDRLGQIALTVADLGRATAFYRDKLGMQFLFEAPPHMAFFDCGGVRLLLDQAPNPADVRPSAVIYFRVADLMLTAKELEARGVALIERPHLVAKMEDHDFWLAAFRDPDGHLLALMQEAPKGYAPPA